MNKYIKTIVTTILIVVTILIVTNVTKYNNKEKFTNYYNTTITSIKDNNIYVDINNNTYAFYGNNFIPGEKITVLMDSKEKITQAYNNTPLVQFSYKQANKNKIVNEYTDNTTWSIEDYKNNIFACHVADSVDDEHTFYNKKDMENFISNFYKYNRYLNNIESLIKY